jgi:CheY-like chemotaxis protein
MVDVILVSKNWQSRALLRAQLIEEGVEVEAHETIAELGTPPVHPHPKARFPKLLVADLSAGDDSNADLDRLAVWAARIPVWILAAHSIEPADKLTSGGFEAILFRPVDLHELVERIKQRIK